MNPQGSIDILQAAGDRYHLSILFRLLWAFLLLNVFCEFPPSPPADIASTSSNCFSPESFFSATVPFIHSCSLSLSVSLSLSLSLYPLAFENKAISVASGLGWPGPGYFPLWLQDGCTFHSIYQADWSGCLSPSLGQLTARDGQNDRENGPHPEGPTRQGHTKPPMQASESCALRVRTYPPTHTLTHTYLRGAHTDMHKHIHAHIHSF